LKLWLIGKFGRAQDVTVRVDPNPVSLLSETTNHGFEQHVAGFVSADWLERYGSSVSCARKPIKDLSLGIDVLLGRHEELPPVAFKSPFATVSGPLIREREPGRDVEGSLGPNL